jgi:hypothetical protein
MMKSFGQQLRICRRQCSDPDRGGLLTQERLGELMGRKMGDSGYSGAAVSDWERDKSKIHADDRRVLVSLLTILHEGGGVEDVAAADTLLAAGNYRRLNGEEAAVVFPQMAAGPSKDRAEAPAKQEAARSRAQRVLLEKVESFWVDGVLKKGTAGGPLLSLPKCMFNEAVDHPWEAALGQGLIRVECEVEEDLATLFQLADRALLVLGSPGSGKTMSLIGLASSLLERAKEDEKAPIPVILDLSGWAKERRDLPSWIVEELTAKYQIPRRYGRRWLENDELLLLLDGFDVLPEAARVPCIKAVNRFRETHGLCGLVICSRSQEYLACGHKLRLNQAVRIEPLTSEQIEGYLQSGGFVELQQAVEEDSAVRQMAQLPLLLKVLAAVGSAGEVAEAPGEPQSEGAILEWPDYEAVFEAYSRQMFDRRPAHAAFSAEQTLQYLNWLAGRLEEHTQSIFMIEAMQPSWLPSRRWRWVYMLLSGLLLGLAGGVIMWLLWRLLRHALPQLPAAVSAQIASWFNLAPAPVELLTIILGNLALGLLVGIILALFFETRRQKPVQASKISGQRWLQVWTVGLASGIVTTLFVAFFSDWPLAAAWGVAEGFMYMAAARFIFGWRYETDVRTVEALGWSWRRALTGSLVGVILTVIAEVLETQLYGYNGFERTLLTLVVAGFILGGLAGSSTTEKSRPNQGVWLSLRNAGVAAVMVSLPLAFLTALMRDPIYALNMGLLTAVIAAALFGAGVFVKHFLLRGLLRWQRKLPWRYVRFLDYAAQLVFLRKVGGGYIFMHRLLQQYFAGLQGHEKRRS